MSCDLHKRPYATLTERCSSWYSACLRGASGGVSAFDGAASFILIPHHIPPLILR